MTTIDCRVGWWDEKEPDSEDNIQWTVFKANPLEFEVDFQKTDCIILTSANAVKALFNQVQPKELPENLMWGCVGTETQKHLQSLLLGKQTSARVMTNLKNTGLFDLLCSQLEVLQNLKHVTILTAKGGKTLETLTSPMFGALRSKTTVVTSYFLERLDTVPSKVQAQIKNSDMSKLEFRCRSGKVFLEVVDSLRKMLSPDSFSRIRFRVWGQSTADAVKELGLELQTHFET